MLENIYDDLTEPLSNGAEIPSHPSQTTARKIIAYGRVKDAKDGTPLRAGLHHATIRGLMDGHQMGLTHLYAYAMLNNKIYHTRPGVVIEVRTIDAPE